MNRYDPGDRIQVLWNADTGRQPQLWRNAKVLKVETHNLPNVWYWCAIDPSPEYWPARHYWVHQENTR